MDFAEDVYSQTCEDAAQGFMTVPVPIWQVDLSKVSVTIMLSSAWVWSKVKF